MSSEFKWYGPEVIKKMEEATEVGLTACAMHLQEQARLLAPTDLNRLRDSIIYKVGNKKSQMGNAAKSEDEFKTMPAEKEAIVGTGVHYAPWVERGHTPVRLFAGPGGVLEDWARRNRIKDAGWITVSGEPRPFLRPAFDAVKGVLNAIFNKEYNRIMGKE